MRVEVVRSGGLIGAPRTVRVEVDPDNDPDDLGGLAAAVAACGEGAAGVEGAARARDTFRWRVRCGDVVAERGERDLPEDLLERIRAVWTSGR